MRGAPTSLLRVVATALLTILQLSRTADDLFLHYGVAILKAALANQHKQGFGLTTVHKKSEGKSSTPVEYLARRQTVEIGKKRPAGRKSTRIETGKRKR
ncbi:unnamed protein product [Linum trigynum]|uniref:Secreted protein n=1 Tax=Linum trigynum TaxID=586398 RepID=A0AAV2CD73_9ROSI